jgi:hypothetical protein
LRTKAPERWYGRAQVPAGKPSPVEVDMTAGEAVEVGAAARKKAWVRLLAKFYDVDSFLCPQCGGRMTVIAVIQDPAEIRGIIGCLAEKGRGPPGSRRKNSATYPVAADTCGPGSLIMPFRRG